MGVALGIAVFVAIQIANASVLGAFGASLDAVAGKSNLQIRGGNNGLPEELFTRIQQRDDSRIQAMAPQLSRTVFSPTVKTTLLVSGIDIFSELDFRSRDLPSAPVANRGEKPENRDESYNRNVKNVFEFLLDPQAIAVSRAVANKGRLKIGDPFVLTIGSETKKLRIVSILDDEASGRAFGGDYAILDIATAQETFQELGKLSQIDFIVDENKVDSVIAELKKLAPPDALVSRPAQRTEQVSVMLAAFQLNLTALSSIAAFVGAFLIYNALASAVVRRRSEAGILRAVGASPSQITRLFLVEAAFIGAFGAMIGCLLGLLLAKWTLGAVATTVSQLYIAVKARELFVPLWLFPVSILSGTLLSVLAAWPAAREAAFTSPRQALVGSTLHHALEKRAKLLVAIGLGLLLVATGLCLPQVSGSNPLLGFVAAGATLGGFAFFVPAILLVISRLLRPLAEKLGGIEGALAADNLRRALNRSSLVIAALMVCIALTTGMNVMVRSFRGTVGEWIDHTIAADLFIAPAGGFDDNRGPGIPQQVTDYSTKNTAVKSFDLVRRATIEIGGQPIQLMANDLPTLKAGERILRFVSTQSGENQAIDEFLSGRAILVSERLANTLKLQSGGQLTIPTPKGQQSFRIAGVFYDYNPNAVFYLSLKRYREIWDDYKIDGIALYLNQSTSGEAMKQNISDRFGARYSLVLLPNKEIRTEVFDTFDQTFAVTYALQLIALIVAAVGVFDTLAAMMLERTTENASLRAMGARRWQIQKLAFWEFGLLGLLAWLLGTMAGLVLAGQMIFVINKQFFGWTIFPIFQMDVPLQSLLLAMLAALGAGIIPARMAVKSDLATALLRE
jgi:putative ABC transport system permease protein